MPTQGHTLCGFSLSLFCNYPGPYACMRQCANNHIHVVAISVATSERKGSNCDVHISHRADRVIMQFPEPNFHVHLSGALVACACVQVHNRLSAAMNFHGGVSCRSAHGTSAHGTTIAFTVAMADWPASKHHARSSSGCSSVVRICMHVLPCFRSVAAQRVKSAAWPGCCRCGAVYVYRTL